MCSPEWCKVAVLRSWLLVERADADAEVEQMQGRSDIFKGLEQKVQRGVNSVVTACKRMLANGVSEAE